MSEELKPCPFCGGEALFEEVKELEKCARYFGLDFDEDEPLRDRLKEASEAFAEAPAASAKPAGWSDATMA